VANPEPSPYRWFLTLWPLAVLFHLAGNDWHLLNFTAVGVLQIPFLIAAIAMLFRPTPITAAALAATHILVVSAKLPVVGNHEILLLLIHVAVVIAVFTKDKRWLPAVVPPLRWVLLIAYSAIAFSKLNEDFVDRAVSCAVIFGDEFGDWVNVSVSNSAALSYMVIALTLLFELSIPIMLMTRSLRRFGVAVAMVFHTVLALEPVGHVFDFTSVLFLLFLLFLTPTESSQLDHAVQRMRDRLLPRWGVIVVAAMIVGNVLTHRARQNGSFGPSWLFDYPLWLVYAAFLFSPLMPIGLDFYTDQGGFIVPEANLVQWARDFPSLDVDVELVQGDGYADAGPPQFFSVQDLAASYRPTDSLVDKVLFIRAVDPTAPTSCRRLWGPAN